MDFQELRYSSLSIEWLKIATHPEPEPRAVRLALVLHQISH